MLQSAMMNLTIISLVMMPIVWAKYDIAMWYYYCNLPVTLMTVVYLIMMLVPQVKAQYSSFVLPLLVFTVLSGVASYLIAAVVW